MFVTESAVAVTQPLGPSNVQRWLRSATTMFLAILAAAALAANASAQTAERRFAANLTAVIDMTATPLVQGNPASFQLRDVISSSIYSSVAHSSGFNQISDAYYMPDPDRFPLHTDVAAGTASASASSSDIYGNRVGVSAEVTGDGWPYGRASSYWQNHFGWTLSGNSTLTFTVHLIGDATGRQGDDFGHYFYRFVLESWPNSTRLIEEGVAGPLDEFFTLTITNDSASSMSGTFWSGIAAEVMLMPVVPEPGGAAMYLVGVTLIGLFAVRQRRRNRLDWGFQNGIM